jgi:hypothetical protein
MGSNKHRWGVGSEQQLIMRRQLRKTTESDRRIESKKTTNSEKSTDSNNTIDGITLLATSLYSHIAC